MTAVTILTARCPSCGARDLPWGRGHARSCESYIPPDVRRRCRCGQPAAIADVDPIAAHVLWRCDACRTTWREDVSATDIDHDDIRSDD